MWLTLIILGAIAAFILFQLYNVLGRRVGFKADEQPQQQQPTVIRTDDSPTDILARLEKKPEGLKIPNLEQLKVRDSSFNELNFIEKSRETYESVVLAFNNGELEGVRDRLDASVYKVFADAVAAREPDAPRDALSFVDTPKADIDSIEVKDDVSVIRMRFLSEILYQSPVKDEGVEPVKAYRRTAEYWTFQKSLKSQAQPWVLTKVEAAKA